MLSGRARRGGHPTESTGLKIGDGSGDFGARVHDERPHAGNRFIDRFAAQDEDHAVRFGRKFDGIALRGKQRELGGRHTVLRARPHRAAQHDGCAGMAGRNRQHGGAA